MGKYNKFCFTAFVSGIGYQRYIPLFLYSIAKAYPEHDSIIYCQEALDPHVSVQLDLIKPIYNFEIVEHYLSDVQVKGQRLKALRWIMIDERLEAYEYVYNVDIDIFYIKESPSLLDQHISHSELIGIPVSNVYRPEFVIDNYNIISFLKRIYHNGIVDGLKSLTHTKTKSIKASGLHFFKTKEYFEAIRPFIAKYREIIENPKSSFIHHKEGFHNESVLADLMNDTGMGANMPYITDEDLALDYREYRQTSFRPHHGVHLGIFMSDAGVTGSKSTLDHEVYKYYYREYIGLIENDPIWSKLYTMLSPEVQLLLDRMVNYYNTHKV
tara:strand:+ start:7330 stop:8307 length:978 start_codon:yes stop_codon:yes gene_type:complete